MDWGVDILYGWIMSQYLSHGNFEFYAINHITEEWILSLTDDTEIGYTLLQKTWI